MNQPTPVQRSFRSRIARCCSTSSRSANRAIVALLAALVALAGGSALAVKPAHWTHTSEADFKAGTFENVVATNLGDLKLSREVKTLLDQDARVSTVYALAETPDGTLYAATGPQGILLSIRDGKVTTAAELGEDQNIFSLAVDPKGRLLIGVGGETGKLLRLDKPGAKPVELFKHEDVQYIWAIEAMADGHIYLATGPTGMLFDIDAKGKATTLLESNESNLLSMVSDGKDLLYIGTDPNGLVYRVNRKTREAFVMYDAEESEVGALALDKDGNLYAGTSEASDAGAGGAADDTGTADNVGRTDDTTSGVPIPTPAPKEPTPPTLPDPNPGEPPAIPKKSAPAKEGKGEQGRAPGVTTRSSAMSAARGHSFHGVQLAVNPHGAGVHPLMLAQQMQDMPGDGDGGDNATPQAPTPDATTEQSTAVPGAPAPPRAQGNAIYRIDKDGFVTEIFRQPVEVMTILEREGKLLVGTGDEGLVYQVDPNADETLVLAKVDPKQVMCLCKGKDGRIYMGLGNSGGVAVMSSGYASSGTYTSAVLDATQVSHFGKLRLDGSLPADTTLTVATRSGNVQDPTAEGWSKWSDEVAASQFMEIKSPSARFAQYRLTFTSDSGKNTAVVDEVDMAYQIPNLAPRIKAIKVGPEPDQAMQMAAAGDASPAAPKHHPKYVIAWDAADPNSDALSYSVYFRRGHTGPWILMKDKLKEPTYEWDTRTVGDGKYEIRVVASDALANVKGDGKEGSRISDPVLVDNTAPIIGDLAWQKQPGGATVKLRAIDRADIVESVEYTVDSADDWQAVLPSDKIFDTPDESVSFPLTGLKPGQHQVTVRATDHLGNQSFETVTVTVEETAGPATR